MPVTRLDEIFCVLVFFAGCSVLVSDGWSLKRVIFTNRNGPLPLSPRLVLNTRDITVWCDSNILFARVLTPPTFWYPRFRVLLRGGGNSDQRLVENRSFKNYENTF